MYATSIRVIINEASALIESRLKNGQGGSDTALS